MFKVLNKWKVKVDRIWDLHCKDNRDTVALAKKVIELELRIKELENGKG